MTNENETKTKQAVESGVKVAGIVTVKAEPIPRNITSETIGREIASRIKGKMLGFDDLFDAKTKTFLTEAELVAKGATFITVSLNKVLGKNDTTTKSRLTKKPTPYIRKTSKYQIIANINWQSFINKRGHGDFIPSEHRANGVVNVEDCKAVGITKAENYTLNGVAFRVLEPTKYYDENNQEYPDTKALEAEYLKKPSKESKEREARKHGIEVKFDPKYRTTRIDSCDHVTVFGFDYRPTDRNK